MHHAMCQNKSELIYYLYEYTLPVGMNDAAATYLGMLAVQRGCKLKL